MAHHLQAQGVLSQVPGMINMHNPDTESVNSVASMYKSLDDVKIQSLEQLKYFRNLDLEYEMSSVDYGTEAMLFQEISDAFMTGSVQIPKRVLTAMYEYSEADNFMCHFLTLLVRALGDSTLFTRTNSRCTELHRNHMVQVGSRFPVVCFKIYPLALSVFLHRQKLSDSASRSRLDELKNAFPETQLQVDEIIEEMCAFDFLVGEGAVDGADRLLEIRRKLLSKGRDPVHVDQPHPMASQEIAAHIIMHRLAQHRAQFCSVSQQAIQIKLQEFVEDPHATNLSVVVSWLHDMNGQRLLQPSPDYPREQMQP